MLPGRRERHLAAFLELDPTRGCNRLTDLLPSVLWGLRRHRKGPRLYRDIFLEAPLREDAVESRPKRPLGQDGKHDALKDQ